MPDDEVLGRCRAGDEQAFADLFQRYQLRAWRLAYAITGDRTLADDVTQEAFIQAFKAIGNVRPGAPFAPWFYAIVANHAKRTAARRRWWSVLSVLEVKPDQWAEAAMQAVEQWEDLWQHIRELPVDLRTVIGLRFVLDLSEADTAAILGVPAGTVKSRLHRARQILQQKVTPYGKEADAQC